MPNVQMTIGLRRKACNNFVVLTRLKVLYNNIANEIAYRWNLLVIQWISLLTGFWKIKVWILSYNGWVSL